MTGPPQYTRLPGPPKDHGRIQNVPHHIARQARLGTPRELDGPASHHQTHLRTAKGGRPGAASHTRLHKSWTGPPQNHGPTSGPEQRSTGCLITTPDSSRPRARLRTKKSVRARLTSTGPPRDHETAGKGPIQNHGPASEPHQTAREQDGSASGRRKEHGPASGQDGPASEPPQAARTHAPASGQREGPERAHLRTNTDPPQISRPASGPGKEHERARRRTMTGPRTSHARLLAPTRPPQDHQRSQNGPASGQTRTTTSDTRLTDGPASGQQVGLRPALGPRARPDATSLHA